ncbi:acid protease [Epithele typhae]|uniref:acid protease n=1 Tax=Epithele typhae TaxID=378194 RepID=UPI002008E9F7|nr:acid protease [Epithele typhae]KAH9945177.1 acid protease [Epithele typhae]
MLSALLLLAASLHAATAAALGAAPRWRPDLRGSKVTRSLRARSSILGGLGDGLTPSTVAPNTTIVPLTLASDKQTYYALSKIGNVNLRLALDTASADLWVVSSDCTSSDCDLPRYPLAFESATFGAVNSNNTAFEISYADGTGAKGFIARESVSIGNMTVGNQALGLVSSSTVPFPDDISGVLGLGFPRLSSISSAVVNATPFFSTMAQSAALSYPVFGLSLTRDSSGSLTFGGIDSSVVNNRTLIEWNEVVPFAPFSGSSGNSSSYLHWVIGLESISVSGSSITPNPSFPAQTMNTSLALIDAGTSGIIGPYQDVAQIFSKIESARLVDEDSGQWVVPCEVQDTIAFNFGGVDFLMQPTDYLIGPASGNPNLCLSWPQGRAPQADGIDWQIGAPFLRTVYSVFSHGINAKEPPMLGFYSIANATTLTQSTASVAAFLASNSATVATTLPNSLLNTPTTFTTPTYTFNTSVSASAGQVFTTGLANATYTPALNAKSLNATRLATLLPSPTAVTLIITDTNGQIVTTVSHASSTVTLGVIPGWTQSGARAGRVASTLTAGGAIGVAAAHSP